MVMLVYQRVCKKWKPEWLCQLRKRALMITEITDQTCWVFSHPYKHTSSICTHLATICVPKVYHSRCKLFIRDMSISSPGSYIIKHQQYIIMHIIIYTYNHFSIELYEKSHITHSPAIIAQPMAQLRPCRTVWAEQEEPGFSSQRRLILED